MTSLFQNTGIYSLFFTAKFLQLSVCKFETVCRINNSVMEEDGIRPSPSVQFHVETLFITVIFTEAVRSSYYIGLIGRIISE
jgi:hypothetical protein